MSATIWKKRGDVRPYEPRNWAIPHVGVCNQEVEREAKVRVEVRGAQEAIELPLAKLQAGMDGVLLAQQGESLSDAMRRTVPCLIPR